MASQRNILRAATIAKNTNQISNDLIITCNGGGFLLKNDSHKGFVCVTCLQICLSSGTRLSVQSMLKRRELLRNEPRL